MATCGDEMRLATMDPRELVVAPPFSDLFPISPEIRGSILASMRDTGFDESKPINVWINGNVVIDGHTRRACAIDAGIPDVPVFFHDFKDEETAFNYAIANQRDRRNMTGADILRCVMAIDRRIERGGDHGNQYTADKTTPVLAKASVDAFAKKSAVKTGELIGVSHSTVERCRVIIDHAKDDPSFRDSVLEGKKTIRSAAREISRINKSREDDDPTKIAPKSKEASDPIKIAPAAPKERPRHSSVIQLSPEDEAWLSTFRIRSKVVAHRFDESAMLWRANEGLVHQIKENMSIVGQRSEVGMSLYHRALVRLASIPPIDHWAVCHRCNGSGTDKGLCRLCHGGGFLIEGF